MPVERRIQLGPTNIVRAALLAGQIDIYPEYTGNGALFFHRETDPAWKDAAAGYAEVKQLDRAENVSSGSTRRRPTTPGSSRSAATWRAFRQRKCLDDLAAYLAKGGRFKLAASAEFVESPAALPAFEATYGFQLRRRPAADPVGRQHRGDLARRGGGHLRGQRRDGLRHRRRARRARPHRAVRRQGRADRLCAGPGGARRRCCEQHPQIAAALDPVFASLTLTTLQELNARIAVAGEDAGAVARDYLKSRHFLP